MNGGFEQLVHSRTVSIADEEAGTCYVCAVDLWVGALRIGCSRGKGKWIEKAGSEVKTVACEKWQKGYITCTVVCDGLQSFIVTYLRTIAWHGAKA